MNAIYSNPYKALLAADVPMDSHESDLYVLATAQALSIVKASAWTFTYFRSAIDGRQWLDIPFAYEPFWERRQRRATADTA